MILDVLDESNAKQGWIVFLPLTYNGGGREIDLTLSHVYRNSEIYVLTPINRWKYEIDRASVVAVAQVDIFWNMRSLDLTWWPDPERPGAEIFTQCVKRMCEKVCQKTAALRAAVFALSAKNQMGGVQTTPPPGPARVNHIPIVPIAFLT